MRRAVHRADDDVPDAGQREDDVGEPGVEGVLHVLKHQTSKITEKVCGAAHLVSVQRQPDPLDVLPRNLPRLRRKARSSQAVELHEDQAAVEASALS